ncbi:MAG: N-acetylneuraminate synthase family protein [Parcubacteria group bacterium]|nr:N-acetylneuraminate synthase family protein [Parcubacteria group bacterium]
MLIAEIGNNHRGKESTALLILESLIKTSVDALTFQIREPAFYDGSMPERNPLHKEFFRDAIKQCKKKNKKIGFAIADISYVDFLSKEGADFWKTLSWDILNNDLQNALKRTGKPVFVSTGVSNARDIIASSKMNQRSAFIHTHLAAETESANLRAIKEIKKATKRKVAFGSHCHNRNIFFTAIAFEPSDIFFYVKDDTNERCTDDKHAIPLSEVEAFIKELRALQCALGSGKKTTKKNYESYYTGRK